MSAQSQGAADALRPFTGTEEPARELYEYLTGERTHEFLDIDDFLTGLRIARTLVARYDRRTRTEWVFPAMPHPDDETQVAGCTQPWVLVMESSDEGWDHQNRIHESSVISRGVPEPEDIVHVDDVDTIVPACALANKADTWGED